MMAVAYPEGCGSGARRASGPPPGPARLASAALPPNNSGMRAPYPPRLPVPSGFAASGGGLRGPGPGCGPRLPGPGLAFGGPGCGSLAPGRCAALALAIARGPARRPGCGSPPGAPAAAGACPGPGGLRPPGPRPPGRGSCRPPSAPLRAPLRGWGALGLLRAAVAPHPSRPGSPLPCPRPFGPGVGPSGPPGLLRPGAAGRPFGPLGSAAAPGLAGDGGRRRGCGRAELFRECLCSLWEAPGSARCTLGIVLSVGSRGGPCGAADGPTGLVVDATRAGAPARPSRISSRHRSRRSARNKKGDRPVRTYPLYFDAAHLCCCRSWPYLASYSWYAMA